MSRDELNKMKKSGKVVPSSADGSTRVSHPANSQTYRAAPNGDVYVEFDVPIGKLHGHSQGSAQLHGPDSRAANIPGRNSSDFEIPGFRKLEVFN